jgi:dTDP-4-dehydrorhamnose 3,5-epimerase
MIKDLVIKKLERYNDERGWLSEVYRQDETDYRPEMAYISVTKPGVVRGPHEHRYQSDCFVFLGPGNLSLHLWDRRDGSVSEGEHLNLEVGGDNPVMVVVPPGVVHAYKCIGDKDAYCLNMPDKLYRGEAKKEEVDEIRWEEDLDSPYKVD